LLIKARQAGLAPCPRSNCSISLTHVLQRLRSFPLKSKPKECLNMRSVYCHKISPAHDLLDVIVKDAPGHGGASHVYHIEHAGSAGLPAMLAIEFQNGPIGEHGVNGVTQEILLAVVIDRLRSFQSGPFSSRENALALTKCEEALHWLQQRTIDRVRRGVEGLSKA